MEEIISIIVPVYNVEKYLDKCVNSIVNQTYKNLEIILVDDGATDNSPKMCDEWAKKDDRIKVIHKANGGLSDARNTGIKNATGDYLAFVDSDDYIESDIYEVLYKMILRDNADLAMCSFKKVDEQGNDIETKNNVIAEVIGKKEFFERMMNDHSGFYVVAWNKLYKKCLFDNLEYPVGKLYEDSFVIHEVINKCDIISVTNKQLCNYLQNKNGITHRKVDIRNLDKFEFEYNRYKFFMQNGYDYLLKSLRQNVEDKYMRIFPELKINGKSEYKRYIEIRDMIDEIMKDDKESFPLYKKMSIIPPILLRPLLTLKSKIIK